MPGPDDQKRAQEQMLGNRETQSYKSQGYLRRCSHCAKDLGEMLPGPAWCSDACAQLWNQEEAKYIASTHAALDEMSTGTLRRSGETDAELRSRLQKRYS